MASEDQDDDDELLSDEEKKERAAERTQKELSDGADRALNRWHEAAPQETRVAVINDYVENGTLSHEAAGVDELEVQVVEAAFTGHIERTILKPLGLSMDQWSEHIAEEDLPVFRRAVVEGDWQALTQHARAAAKMRLDLGI